MDRSLFPPEPDPPPDRAKAIGNERVKLSATYVNGVAVAILAVGGFAPLFSQQGLAGGKPVWLTPVTSLACLAISGGLHWMARRFLKELR